MGVLHPWTLFLKTLCNFSKNKATSILAVTYLQGTLPTQLLDMATVDN